MMHTQKNNTTSKKNRSLNKSTKALFALMLMTVSTSCGMPIEGEPMFDSEPQPYENERTGQILDTAEGEIIQEIFWHKCPSEQKGLVRILCHDMGASKAMAIIGCVAQINRHLEKIYRNDRCLDCSHGKLCKRIVPEWTVQSFINASNCSTMRTGRGTRTATCTDLAMNETFECVETPHS